MVLSLPRRQGFLSFVGEQRPYLRLASFSCISKFLAGKAVRECKELVVLAPLTEPLLKGKARYS